MLIGVDIDEVLADLISQLVRFNNEQYHTSLKREDFVTYQLRDAWGGSEEEEFRRVVEFYCSPYFRDIKPVKGSVEGVKELNDRGHDLVIITSRHSKGRDETGGWIEKYFPNMFSEIYFTDYYPIKGNMTRKAGICRERGVEVMIEDSLDNARDCVSDVTKVLLLDCPWNRCEDEDLPRGVERVGSWGEIIKRVD